MMLKEAIVPRAETFLRRENSVDALKAKASLHSLPTSENQLVKNGAKFENQPPIKNGAKIPNGKSSQPQQPMPAARFRRNARASSAERSKQKNKYIVFHLSDSFIQSEREILNYF